MFLPSGLGDAFILLFALAMVGVLSILGLLLFGGFWLVQHVRLV